MNNPDRNGEHPHQHTLPSELRADAHRFSHQHPHRAPHSHRTIAGYKAWIPAYDLQPVYADAA